MNKKKCIIIDIDDTLVFENYIDNLPNDNSREKWDLYHEARDFYNPNQYIIFNQVVDLIKSYYLYYCCEIHLVFLTAREDTCNNKNRENTIKLIHKIFGDIVDKNGFTFLMREENDYRPSCQVKKDLLGKYVLHDYSPILIIDDSEENIKIIESEDCIGLRVYNNYKKGMLNE